MKTQVNHKRPLMFKILMVVPILVVLLIALSSCGKSKNTELGSSEIAPPPPPPPPPPPVQPSDSVYQLADEMPLFPGGDAALVKYLSDSTIYPPTAKTNGIQGKTIVRFVVDKTGSVGSASILKGADPLLDEEALRVVSKLPKFKPGIKDGRAVAVYYMIPINFTLK